MSTVKIDYEGKATIIQCLKTNKMLDICKKFSTKLNLELNNLYFLYGGSKINLNMTFQETANSIDNGRNQMNILALDINENEGLICPQCGFNYNINIDSKILDNINNSNSNQSKILNGVKGQITNIINTINKSQENENIINQLNNVIIMIEHIINNIKKNSDEMIKLNNLFDKIIVTNNVNKKNIKSNKPQIPDVSKINKTNLINTSNPKVDIYKNIIPDPESGNWGCYIKNALIHYEDYEDDDNNIYDNILTKAAMIGRDGAEWGRTDNFKIKLDEIKNLYNIFKKNINLDKTRDIVLDGQKYQIINYKNNFSIEIKNGEYGGTIAVTNKAYIFGFFNSNVKYRLNGKEKNQCQEICNKVVENLANLLKGVGY